VKPDIVASRKVLLGVVGGSQHQERAEGVLPGVVLGEELTGGLQDAQSRPGWVLCPVREAIHLVGASWEQQYGGLGPWAAAAVGCFVEVADRSHFHLSCWPPNP